MKSKDYSLSESSYDEIKKRIQEGYYAPGTKLVIQDLSNSLGVSRTPIVSALNRLLAEGLIENTHQKNFVVKSLSIREIRNILELRIMIELYAVEFAIKNVVFCAETIREMKLILEEYKDFKDDDYDKVCDIECRFHQAYISLLGNKEILQIFHEKRCVEITYSMYKMANLPLSTMKDAYEAHEVIVRCLENRDEEALFKLLKNHMHAPMEALDWLIKNSENPASVF